jgi:hypothetical protein
MPGFRAGYQNNVVPQLGQKWCSMGYPLSLPRSKMLEAPLVLVLSRL